MLGPRQTGKSSLIKRSFNTEESLYINLLLSREYTRLKRDPSLLAQDILGRAAAVKYIVIDEVQRVPEILDEIHQIIESPNSPWFILTGSSARKLKRSKANLLGGRASTSGAFSSYYFRVKRTLSARTRLLTGPCRKSICKRSQKNAQLICDHMLIII